MATKALDNLKLSSRLQVYKYWRHNCEMWILYCNDNVQYWFWENQYEHFSLKYTCIGLIQAVHSQSNTFGYSKNTFENSLHFKTFGIQGVNRPSVKRSVRLNPLCIRDICDVPPDAWKMGVDFGASPDLHWCRYRCRWRTAWRSVCS